MGRPRLYSQKRKKFTATLPPWLKDWLQHQQKNGIIASRLIEIALIEKYNLEPPMKILEDAEKRTSVKIKKGRQ